MIKRKELAICKRRGHKPQGDDEKWERCKYCGMWTRTVSVKEEREDDPPEEDQDPMYSIERRIAALGRATATQKEKDSAAPSKVARPDLKKGKKGK